MYKYSIVNNAKKIGLALMMTTLATSFGPNFETTTQLPQSFHPVSFSKEQDLQWVKNCILQYPEIHYLADAEVRKTEEGQATTQRSYSEQLFNQKFIEFDRTIMTLHCLQLILDGSDNAYQEFTEAQPNDVKLSFESFGKLHLQGITLINFQHNNMSKLEITQAMEASLVLGDIGKSEKAREIFKPYGASAIDHDDFHEEVMGILKKYPELSPTFDKLTTSAKELLIQTANLIHYGHVTHLEGGAGMFSKLKESKLPSLSPFALEFDFFVHQCDVAGALGHVNIKSSLAYTELSHKAMQAVAEACQVLANPEKTEMDAYNAYLKIRGDWLDLNPNDTRDRVLIRLGAMLRLFSPSDGVLLRKAILELDAKQLTKIILQLDTKEGEDLERTPTYMPAVLVNLSNNFVLGTSREERISQAIKLGSPFLSRVLEKHKQSLAQNIADAKTPLNFNKAAGIAKEKPFALLNEFDIDQKGNINILDQ